AFDVMQAFAAENQHSESLDPCIREMAARHRRAVSQRVSAKVLEIAKPAWCLELKFIFILRQLPRLEHNANLGPGHPRTVRSHPTPYTVDGCFSCFQSVLQDLDVW